MNGIRELAHRRFPNPKPEVGKHYPDLERIQIRIDASGLTIPAEFTKETSESYIKRLYQMTPYDKSTDKATFELVHITRNKAGDPPNINPEAYKCLSQNQGWIDHFILDILNHKNYGFYHVPEEASTNQVHTFLITSVLYTLLWTYHAPTATTKGMLVSRSCCIVGSSTIIYREFAKLLRSYQDHIDNPSLLIFISSSHLISSIDRCLVEVRDSIRRIEVDLVMEAGITRNQIFDGPRPRLLQRPIGTTPWHAQNGPQNARRHWQTLSDKFNWLMT
jgi:hypothetical protein